MNAPLRRWSLSEEVTIVKMRRENACAKMIARELGRTPESVGQHVHKMRQRAHITQHRLEEIALLERLLEEAASPEIHARERV
jgi:predicted transcriptional regulator